MSRNGCSHEGEKNRIENLLELLCAQILRKDHQLIPARALSRLSERLQRVQIHQQRLQWKDNQVSFRAPARHHWVSKT